MEAQWQADRAALRDLLLMRPDLSLKEMATLLKRSYSWAKRWAARLREASPTDQTVLRSHSRARKTPTPDWDAKVLQRIEEIRLAPPGHLGRTPGPKAILYYLHHDPVLQQGGCPLPRAASTIWKLLHRLGFLSTLPHAKQQNEQQFTLMVRDRKGGQLDTWLSTVAQSSLRDLHPFVKGIRSDIEEVEAGLILLMPATVLSKEK